MEVVGSEHLVAGRSRVASLVVGAYWAGGSISVILVAVAEEVLIVLSIGWSCEVRSDNLSAGGRWRLLPCLGRWGALRRLGCWACLLTAGRGGFV